MMTSELFIRTFTLHGHGNTKPGREQRACVRGAVRMSRRRRDFRIPPRDAAPRPWAAAAAHRAESVAASPSPLSLLYPLAAHRAWRIRARAAVRLRVPLRAFPVSLCPALGVDADCCALTCTSTMQDTYASGGCLDHKRPNIHGHRARMPRATCIYGGVRGSGHTSIGYALDDGDVTGGWRGRRRVYGGVGDIHSPAWCCADSTRKRTTWPD